MSRAWILDFLPIAEVAPWTRGIVAVIAGQDHNQLADAVLLNVHANFIEQLKAGGLHANLYADLVFVLLFHLGQL